MFNTGLYRLIVVAGDDECLHGFDNWLHRTAHMGPLDSVVHIEKHANAEQINIILSQERMLTYGKEQKFVFVHTNTIVEPDPNRFPRTYRPLEIADTALMIQKLSMLEEFPAKLQATVVKDRYGKLPYSFIFLF